MKEKKFDGILDKSNVFVIPSERESDLQQKGSIDEREKIYLRAAIKEVLALLQKTWGGVSQGFVLRCPHYPM